MRISLDARQCRNFEVSSRREWLLTNGIGGFAMGTASGANTRRYHGHLVAATVPPTTRTSLLGNIEAAVQTDGNPIGLSCNQYQGAVYPEGHLYLEGFTATDRFVEWHYKAQGVRISKTLAMHPGQNAVTIRYRNDGAIPCGLTLRPLVLHRSYHASFRVQEGYPQALLFPKNKTILENGGVTLFLRHEGAQRVPAVGWYYRFEYPRELERGLDPKEDLFCPCELRYELLPGEEAVIVASTEERVSPLAPPDLSPTGPVSLGDQLRDAAAPFFVETKKRASIIAGYPWFTDWGRDTMISIPGLCLHTGRVAVARRIILDYAAQMYQGLIPNRFVENDEPPEYNTVDGTLWFANAIYRTLEAEWDDTFAKKCFKALDEMFRWHVKGTLFGIGVDPDDGLLRQGEYGRQLTWMDAKVGDWVVTPRHGKPVEINGLWINALRILDWLGKKLSKATDEYSALASQAESNFERKFWRPVLGHYLDTADPDDASLRPNQVITMALPFSPMDSEHAKAALAKVGRELLTPVGLRTLGPTEPGYRGRFAGGLAELDAAYHQGTAWPWLLGPYVTALVKLNGDKAEAKRILKGARDMLVECGIGGISEVYDGDEPRSPGGCPWQAWSVAEILRAWIEDAGGK
ncbi:MAG: amylo-alpha-1,6-glucosidase [Fimbriimonadaceae bacterium]|nr:amylo-alpha-1,6-glucosidase [Fimbriimonadaceae bacterium]